VYWQGQDRKTLRRINALIQDADAQAHSKVSANLNRCVRTCLDSGHGESTT
jgi:Txe/YoeB family toxin of Txe-Axe toxin-antitoxin module